MNEEPRIVLLERQLRRLKAVLVALAIVAISAISIGAASVLKDEVIRGKLSILDDKDKAQVTLDPSGQVEVKGVLRVKDTDILAAIKKLETDIANLPKPGPQIQETKFAYRRNLVITEGKPANPQKGIQTIVPPIQGAGGNDVFQIDETFGKEVLACWMVPINSVNNYKFAHAEMYPDDTRAGGLRVRAVASNGQPGGCMFGFYVIYR